MEVNCTNFVESLVLDTHPIQYTKAKFKMQYYFSLKYLIEQCDVNDEYTSARLKQYRIAFLGDADLPNITEKDCKNITYSIVNSRTKLWRKKNHYWLLCDIALILFDEDKIKKMVFCLNKYLNKRQTMEIEILKAFLFNNEEIPKKIFFTKGLVEQFRANVKFATKPQKRYVVTANVSAGKSTLINAIIGKSLIKTSQEICTGNLCYIYNKPFEDDFVHLSASHLNLNASSSDFSNVEKSAVSSIASYFRIVNLMSRICIIDTPGVNSVIDINHKKITRQVLKEENYNKLIYVLNANKLGTDEEKEQLQWVAENVAKEKVIFVLNKIDYFKTIDDSIEESINGVKNDLYLLGYKEPIICPFSAYFAYLIKLKENGEVMSEDEIDSFNLYFKKFSKAEYDLSIYYREVESDINESELFQIRKKCGLYGLEQVLFGG